MLPGCLPGSFYFVLTKAGTVFAAVFSGNKAFNTAFSDVFLYAEMELFPFSKQCLSGTDQSARKQTLLNCTT